MSIINKIGWGRSKTILRPNAIRSLSFRGLFDGQDLGMPGYQRARSAVEHAIVDHATFKKKLSKNLLDKEFSLAGIESGLKNLIHLMKDDMNDVMILKAALKTLINKQQNYVGEKYSFDVTVMRAFHFLNMPDEAVEFFEDEIVGELFNKVTGHQILLDLLYENGKYADVLRIYENINKNGLLCKNKHINAIIFATYYRLNTPEALQQSIAMYTELTEKFKFVQFRKSRTFVAGLAVKYHRSEIALKLVEDETKYATFVTVRHIKILAWAELGQFANILTILQTVLEQHKKNPKYKPATSIEVLNQVDGFLRQKGSKEEIEKFCEMRNKIKSLKLETEETLDDILCKSFPAVNSANINHRRAIDQ